jgi:hypothetical protein
LEALVIGGAVSFAVTFAVKVPSNYVLNESVGAKVLAAKTPQSRGILLFRNPDNMLGRGFMQFFSYDPSANPLELMWSLQSYVIFVWGFEKVGVQYRQTQDGKIVLTGQFGDSVLDPSEIVVMYRSGDALKDAPVTRPEQIEVFSSITAFEAAHGDHGKLAP